MDIEKANESINVPFNSHEEYFTRSVCISLLNIIVLDLESCFLLKHCTLLSSVFLTINCMPIKVFLPWEDLRFFRLTAVLSFLYFLCHVIVWLLEAQSLFSDFNQKQNQSDYKNSKLHKTKWDWLVYSWVIWNCSDPFFWRNSVEWGPLQGI